MLLGLKYKTCCLFFLAGCASISRTIPHSLAARAPLWCSPSSCAVLVGLLNGGLLAPITCSEALGLQILQDLCFCRGCAPLVPLCSFLPPHLTPSFTPISLPSIGLEKLGTNFSISQLVDFPFILIRVLYLSLSGSRPCYSC